MYDSRQAKVCKQKHGYMLRINARDKRSRTAAQSTDLGLSSCNETYSSM